MPRCSQVGCRIAETGDCLDGHKQGCPHLLPDEPAGNPSPVEATLPAIDAPSVLESRRFYTGEKLTISEASRLLNERPAQVVLCAGAQWSGKTTFLALIGEMFRDGSFTRYRFGGSLTLCAFERATWRATIASGAERPDTQRTPRRENDTFLHLRVYPAGDSDGHLELLISDLAGETFPTAVASREFCADLRSLARADHLVIFLDCAKLADQVKRHPERDNARTFLQQVSAVKHQSKSLQVQVVFSREDYITRNPEHVALETFCEAIQAEFTERFAASFGSLEFWRIAARPDGDISPTKDGIQSLFARWLEAPLAAPPVPASRNRNPARDFCGFGLI